MLSFRCLLEYIGKCYNVSEQDSNDFYLTLVIVVVPVPQSLPGREWPRANILGECFPSEPHFHARGLCSCSSLNSSLSKFLFIL